MIDIHRNRRSFATIAICGIQTYVRGHEAI